MPGMCGKVRSGMWTVSKTHLTFPCTLRRRSSKRASIRYICNIITDCPINKEYCKEIQWKMLQLDYISGLLFCRRLHTYSILTMAKLFKNDICPILKNPLAQQWHNFVCKIDPTIIYQVCTVRGRYTICR